LKGLLGFLVSGWALVSLAAAAPLYTPPAQKTPIEITADGENRFEAGMAYAQGNVVVRYADDVLYADEITFDQKQRVITAKGNVSIYTLGRIYRGDQLQFNVDSKEVKSLDFRTVQERLYLAGSRLDNPRADQFIVKDAILTTENSENPSYKLKASTIELYPGDWVVMKNVAVYIGPVPVMWLPYVAVPLDEDTDAFDFTLGSNSRLGFYVEGAYTASLNDRTTVTPHVGWFSRRGIGYGLDGEFKPRPGDRGQLKSFFINDNGTDIGMSDPARVVQPDNNRYRASYQHKFQISPEFTTTADINIWSDRFITEDFFPREFRNERQPDNFMDLTYYDPNFTGTLLARAQVNNLFNVTERKPEFSLEFKEQPIGAGFFYTGESSIVNFERQFDRDSIAGPNPSSVRYDSYHQISYPGQYFNWLSLNPRAGVRGTIHTRSNSPVITKDSTPESSRLAFNLGLESSFKVSRVWSDVQDADWGIDGLRHVFQPYVNASYTPEPNETPRDFVGYDNRLPSTRLSPLQWQGFNSIDSINEQTAIRHGVRNRLQTKRDGRNVDLIDWDLYGQANITRNRDMGILVDDVYSHVFSHASVYPLPWLRFDSYMAFGLTSDAFDEFENSITWQVHPALELTLSHLYLDNVNYTDPAFPTGRFLIEDSNLFGFSTFWRLNENWKISQSISFEADDGRIQEQRYAVFRDLRAWEMSVGTAIRDNRRLEDEFLVFMTLTLKAFPEASLTVDQ
jgi:LPS-assembly protein